MPTYHYRCSACGHSFDAFQKFSEDPLTLCPVCEGSIRRVIQPVGVVFKGSGWYVTDSRSSSTTNAKTPAEKSAAEKPAAEKKSDTVEAKPSTEKAADTKVATPA